MASVVFTFGGDEGDRTPDLLTASQARSQLRYAPKLSLFGPQRPHIDYIDRTCTCQRY